MKKVLYYSIFSVMFVMLMALMVMCNTGVALAEDSAIVRTITVSGSADISVIPDMVVFRFGVEMEDQNLDKVKVKSDSILNDALSVTRKYAIAKEDVKTDYINIRPRYRNEERYYYVQRTVTVTLRKLDKFDKFLNDLMASGINTVYSIQFVSSEAERFQDDALILAVKDARSKAELIAKELGLSVGKALKVGDESNQVMYDAPEAQYMLKAASSNNTISVGKIYVNSRVNITFELF